MAFAFTANQLECEVAANNMYKELIEDVRKCRTMDNETKQCQWDTARDAQILFETIGQLQKDRQNLSGVDRVKLAALRTLQPRCQTLFNVLYPNFAQNVRLKTERFRSNYKPEPEQVQGVKNMLWDSMPELIDGMFV